MEGVGVGGGGGRWVFNIEIKFTICNLMMTFGIQRRMCNTVNY